jgi:hypothetical protein
VVTAADVESGTGPPPPAPAPPQPSVHFSSLGSDGYYYYPHHGHHPHGVNERSYSNRTSSSFNRDYRIRKVFIDNARRGSLGIGLSSNSGYSSSLKRHSKLDEPPVSSDVVFYEGMTSGGLDSTSRTRSSSHRSTGQSSLLCRCGSGGALLPPASSPSCVPQITSSATNFAREANSLPSTPNASRHLVSVSPRVDRTFRTELGPERRSLAPPDHHREYRDYLEIRNPRDHREHRDHSLLPVPVPVPPSPAPVTPLTNQCYQSYGHSTTNILGDCSGLNLSESAVLAGSCENSRNRGTRVRTLNQLAAQRKSLRYRASSQPLTKLSSLVIAIIAIVIIGFIVLSPLFHYFM